MGNKKRVISLEPIVNALEDEKAEALPGFHAFSEADITGRFAGKGKLTCWQAFSTCSMEMVSAFAALWTSQNLEADTERAIETFVCQHYEPGSTVVDVGDLRWKVFTKKQLQPYMKPLPWHIIRPWCGVRTTFLTVTYHQQQLTGGRKRRIEEVCSNVNQALIGIEEDKKKKILSSNYEH